MSKRMQSAVLDVIILGLSAGCDGAFLTPTPIPTATYTETPSPTRTPTITSTSTITPTPTETEIPTPASLAGVVSLSADTVTPFPASIYLCEAETMVTLYAGKTAADGSYKIENIDPSFTNSGC